MELFDIEVKAPFEYFLCKFLKNKSQFQIVMELYKSLTCMEYKI